MGECSHRHNREAHASEAERRVAEYRDEAQSNREGLSQQNEQSSEGKIADQHEAGRCGDEQRVASKGHTVEDMDDGGVHHHHDQEDGEHRQELAHKPDKRPSAGDAHPGALAASREFRADGVAAGDRRDDVQHSRQDRPEQELGEVQRWVRQNILFRDARTPGLYPPPSAPRGSAAVAAEMALCIAEAALLPGVKYCRL